MDWWWWLWIALVVFLLLLPLTYGWGYRRWGPPYPRYYRARRGAPTRTRAEMAEVEREAIREEAEWGWIADLVWIVLVVAVVWLVLAWIF